MKKLLKLPFLLVLLLASGLLLTGCTASSQAVVTTGPARPYYGAYYGPGYRAQYRPARVVVRPAPVIVRPRPVLVYPGPRYYQVRPYRGGPRW